MSPRIRAPPALRPGTPAPHALPSSKTPCACMPIQDCSLPASSAHRVSLPSITGPFDAERRLLDGSAPAPASSRCACVIPRHVHSPRYTPSGTLHDVCFKPATLLDSLWQPSASSAALISLQSSRQPYNSANPCRQRRRHWPRRCPHRHLSPSPRTLSRRTLLAVARLLAALRHV